MPDAFFDNVGLLLHFDGADGSTTFTDSSASAHTVTPQGDAQIDTDQSKFGGASGLFDGTGDRLEIAQSADFEFGSGDWTVEGWIRCTSTTGNDVFAGYAPSVGGAAAWFMRREGAAWRMQIYTGSTFYGNSTFGTAAADTWYHLAFVRDGNNLRRFVDGVGATPIDITGASLAVPSSPLLYIGAIGANDPHAGWIDELRITKGVARYTSDFTPPTEAFPDEGPPTAPEIDGYVEVASPLGAELVFGTTPAWGLMGIDSVLGAESVLGRNDFTAVLGNVGDRWAMDLVTPSATVRVPISSWQATLRTTAGSYVQCVIPATETLVDTVDAATEFVIYRRAIRADGTLVLEQEMARGPVETVRYDRGPYRHTCTISGYSDSFAENPDPDPMFDRTLAGIRYQYTTGARTRVRCSIDWLLRPAQRAQFDAESMIVDEISYYVNTTDGYMEVAGI